MTKTFLIEVDVREIRDGIGNLVAVWSNPSSLMEDDFGKYIVSKETGEKVYFEFMSDEKLPTPSEPDKT